MSKNGGFKDRDWTTYDEIKRRNSITEQIPVTDRLKVRYNYIDHRTFVRRLDSLRISRNLTKYELAEIADVHICTISDWYNTQNGVFPKTLNLVALCDHFNVSIDWLLGRV